MSKIKIASAFALIFLLGLAAGGVGGTAFAWHRLLAQPKAEDIADHIGGGLRSQLNLTPQQAGRIRPLLLEAGNQGIAIRRDTLHRLAETWDSLDAHIIAELTPEQQEKYAKEKRGSALTRSLKEADANSQKNPSR